MYLFFHHISAFITRSKPSGAGLIGRGGTRSSVDGAKFMRLHDLMASFRRHSTVSEIMPKQLLIIVLQMKSPTKNKITGEPAWLPGRLQSNRRTQMGKANRTRISQRMSQHIMQLKLALRIMASKEITYQDDMLIAHKNSFVNPFFIRRSPCRDFCRSRSADSAGSSRFSMRATQGRGQNCG